MAALRNSSSVGGIPVKLAAFIEDERRRADVVGAVVAAFDAEGLLFAGCFGYADLERAEPIARDTRFRAASITQLFTACLVLQEISAGRLALDDPVNHHLDQHSFVRDERGALDGDVTIRRLLTHTAGLPPVARGFDYRRPDINYFVGGSLRVPKSLADVVANQRTTHPPGTRYAHANGGYSLLGYLVQRTQGVPFRELLQERILQPLGMQRSSIAVQGGGPESATPYGGAIAGAGRKPAPNVTVYAEPAGGLVTTATDLARFGIAILREGELDGARVLAEAMLRDAVQMQVAAHPSVDHGVGFGFQIREFRGHHTITQGGTLPGVATRIAILPEDRLGVLILTNAGDQSFVNRVTDRVLEDLLDLGPETIPGSPRGILEGKAQEWAGLERRAVGNYQPTDKYPPGLVTGIMGLVGRIRLARVADGILALESRGHPMFLYPDGDVGCYRTASNGNRAVLEEQDGRFHLWTLDGHYVRRPNWVRPGRWRTSSGIPWRWPSK